MIDKLLSILAVLSALFVALFLNFLFALAGEPRSFWLFHSVLGWI